MPSTTNVLDEAVEMVKKRLAELDEERKRLEHALAALGHKATVSRGAGRRRRRRRPTASANAKDGAAAKRATAPKPRRRRKGTRGEQAVSLIEKQPGISASEIAKAMKIKPNYLYRVLGDLEKEGRVKKEGRRYSPAG
jgi:predicted Rossmann fold nucleotide-binding protein DprA/Smf involved in DNA uptake